MVRDASRQLLRSPWLRWFRPSLSSPPRRLDLLRLHLLRACETMSIPSPSRTRERARVRVKLLADCPVARSVVQGLVPCWGGGGGQGAFLISRGAGGAAPCPGVS